MDPAEAIFETEDAMNKCVDYLIHEFAGVRTGKASPALIENLDVHVQAYGAVSKLKSLAIINSPEPRMLVVQPFDPATTRDIERAIRECKLGLNPAAADRSIRVPIPELSEERRREIFAALVEEQDKGTGVAKSLKDVAARFGITKQDMTKIEREGMDNEWPPL